MDLVRVSQGAEAPEISYLSEQREGDRAESLDTQQKAQQRGPAPHLDKVFTGEELQIETGTLSPGQLFFKRKTSCAKIIK